MNCAIVYLSWFIIHLFIEMWWTTWIYFCKKYSAFNLMRLLWKKVPWQNCQHVDKFVNKLNKFFFLNFVKEKVHKNNFSCSKFEKVENFIN